MGMRGKFITMNAHVTKREILTSIIIEAPSLRAENRRAQWSHRKQKEKIRAEIKKKKGMS